MKSVLAFLLIASLLAFAHAFPGAARDSAESTETDEKEPNDGVVLVMPRRNIFDDFGEDDDEPAMPPGFWHPFRFNTNPFNDLVTKMQDTMNRIRAQMAAALAGQLGQSGITPWGKIPEGANTTSTTKIIGDHSVTINETTYTDGDENGGTIFRVRVVDVKPLNETINENNDSEENKDDEAPTDSSPEQQNNNSNINNNNNNNNSEERDREELTTPKARDTETLEEFDNEIPKSQVETLTA